MIAFACAGISARAAGATDGLGINVAAGYDGSAASGSWIPVVIHLTNPGADFAGHVRLNPGSNTPRLNFGGNPPSGAGISEETDVVIPHGTTRSLTMYMLAGSGTSNVEVRDSAQRMAASAVFSVTIVDGSGLVAVVSDRADALDQLSAIRLPHNGGVRPVQLIRLRPADLPSQAQLLGSFATVAFDDASTDQLSASQRSALSAYVNGGGTLLVVTGATGTHTMAGLPPGLLGATMTSTVPTRLSAALSTLLETEPLPTPVDVAQFRLEGASAVLTSDRTPVLLHTARGAGHVLVLAVDPDRQPLAAWSGARSLLREALVRLQFATGNMAVSKGFPTGGAPVPGVRAQYYGNYSGPNGGISGALANFRQLDLPALPAVGALLLLYGALVGPFNYLLLRRLGRRDLMWLTVPALVAVFSIASYGYGVSVRGSDIRISRVDVVNASGRSGESALVHSYYGVFVPHRGDYDLVPDRAAFVSATDGQAAVQRGGTITLVGADAYSQRMFASEGTAPGVGTVQATLFGDASLISGSITSHLPYALEDAAVVSGTSAVRLGTLRPGVTAPVNLIGINQNGGYYAGGSPAVLSTLLPQVRVQDVYNGGGSGDRTEIRRYQVMQEVMGSGPVYSAPFLLGWTQGAESMRAGGGNLPVDRMTLVIIPVDVAPPRAPARATLQGAPVDLSLASTSGSSFGAYGLSPGDAEVFEFNAGMQGWHDIMVGNVNAGGCATTQPPQAPGTVYQVNPPSGQVVPRPTALPLPPSVIGSGSASGSASVTAVAPTRGAVASAVPCQAALSLFNARTGTWGPAISGDAVSAADYVDSLGLVHARLAPGPQVGISVNSLSLVFS